MTFRIVCSNFQKWTWELCRKDSDGDGKTNGEELGDPSCDWTTGAVPQFANNISHPGKVVLNLFT